MEVETLVKPVARYSQIAAILMTCLLSLVLPETSNLLTF